MSGVKTEVKGNTLTITVDLSQRRGPSKSGKSELIVSENVRVPGHDGVKCGINVYRVIPQ